MFSPKNKKQKGIFFFLALFVFSSSVLLLAPRVVHAGPLDWMGEQLLWGFKQLLYFIYVVFGWFTSVAITIFEWSIDPNYISGPSGLLNRNSIYLMWKFIRDFFNLFFILTLLYTAFTIVFQVAKDYKKTLLSIVLAALFVNFSFPLTRVIIDMTNVPMYYFVNQMGSTGEKQRDYLGTVLSASQLQSILIPGSENGRSSVDFDSVGTSQLIMAIIFIFIFSVTLLVLAVLFVIRLAALIIILIFASVGFAASVIPGMEKYGNMWWEKLWQYSLFGPAAMLMLYIATKFFAEISKDNTSAQFVQAGISNGTTETAGFISSMAMFTIPIVMLWMAIGLATSFSIMGAGAVTGQGQKFIKWFGRKTYNNPIGRGLYGGAKKTAMDGKAFGFDYGKRAKILTGNYWAAPSKTEAAIKGGIPGGAKGAKSELQKLKDKQIYEQISKDKENKLSRTDAVKRLESSDDVMRISAATSLANMDHGILSMEDLTKALDALKKIDPATGLRTIPDPTYDEKALEIISKADKSIIAATPATGKSGLQNLQSVINSLGKNEKAVNDLIAKLDDSAFDGTAVDYAAVRNAVPANLTGSLDAKIRKEGQSKLIVDYERNQNITAGMTPVQAMNKAFEKVIGSMDADTLAKQSSMHADKDFQTYLKVDLSVPENRGYYQEVFKRMKQKDRQEWISKGNTP